MIWQKKLIIDTDSGENRVVLSTVTYVFGSLLVAIKPDAVADGIGDDGKVTPTVNLNLGLWSYQRCAVIQCRFHACFQVFYLEIHQHASIRGYETGEGGSRGD